MASSRKAQARMSPKGRSRARRDMKCVCSHPYRNHRQERSRVATVCAKCRCGGFTPREANVDQRRVGGTPAASTRPITAKRLWIRSPTA